MAAGASLSRSLGRRRRRTVSLALHALPVLRGDLACVDEVLQLLLVLVRVAIGRVAQHAALLGEVLEGGARVTFGPEAKLARGFGSREGASPAQQVEQLRREEGDPRLAHRECRQLESERGEQRSVQLARGIEELGERLRPRCGDVVRTCLLYTSDAADDLLCVDL